MVLLAVLVSRGVGIIHVLWWFLVLGLVVLVSDWFVVGVGLRLGFGFGC